jgi:hypothetical protein
MNPPKGRRSRILTRKEWRRRRRELYGKVSTTTTVHL